VKQVRFSAAAVTQLREIRAYIAKDPPERADAMVQRIIRRRESIARNPEGGRTVREIGDPSIREMIERPYRIIYRVGPDTIDILAVMHGRRLLPHDLR
jgi:plasmid stabilization system protein ParE